MRIRFHIYAHIHSNELAPVPLPMIANTFTLTRLFTTANRQLSAPSLHIFTWWVAELNYHCLKHSISFEPRLSDFCEFCYLDTLQTQFGLNSDLSQHTRPYAVELDRSLLIPGHGAAEWISIDGHKLATVPMAIGRGEVRHHWIDNVGPGLHRIRWGVDANTTGASRDLAAAPPAYPLPVYPAKLVHFDNTSMGNWVGKYGKAGYQLFNFCPGKTCASGGETDVLTVSCPQGKNVPRIPPIPHTHTHTHTNISTHSSIFSLSAHPSTTRCSFCTRSMWPAHNILF